MALAIRVLKRRVRRFARDSLFRAGVLKQPRESLDDCAIAIVSFAKSGRTWLRTMVGHVLVEALDLPKEKLLDTTALTRAAGLNLTRFTHDGTDNMPPGGFMTLKADKSAYRGKIVHLLYRDPRDIAVSAWFSATKRANLYDGPLSKFIRDPIMGVRKIARFYKQWEDAAAVPKAFHFIRYKHLHADPMVPLRRILTDIGLPVSDAQLQRAIEASSFEHMREMERSAQFQRQGEMLVPRDRADEESYKVRRGVVGGYHDYMSEDDIAYVTQVVAEEGNPFDSW